MRREQEVLFIKKADSLYVLPAGKKFYSIPRMAIPTMTTAIIA